MAERAPKLAWEQIKGGLWDGAWRANIGPVFACILEDGERGQAWYVSGSQYRAERKGRAPTLLAAQLAAEDSALQWLREGVEALGGRVVPDGYVTVPWNRLQALACEVAPKDAALCEQMLALAKELADG